MKIQIFSTSEPFILLRMRNRVFANSRCRRRSYRWCLYCFIWVQHLSASRWFPISLIHFQPTPTHFGYCTRCCFFVYFFSTALLQCTLCILPWRFYFSLRNCSDCSPSHCWNKLMMQQQLSFMMTASLSALFRYLFSSLTVIRINFFSLKLKNTHLLVKQIYKMFVFHILFVEIGIRTDMELPRKLWEASRQFKHTTATTSHWVNVFGSISLKSKWSVIAIFV